MSNERLVAMLTEDLAGSGEITEFLKEVIVTISKNQLGDLANKLKSEKYDFDFLTNLTAVDYEENYVMVYNLRSLVNKYRLTLRVELDKSDPKLPTLINVWKTADWQEREVFDLIGIEFSGHPELNRILLPDDFQGFPLRKDYKLETRR